MKAFEAFPINPDVPNPTTTYLSGLLGGISNASKTTFDTDERSFLERIFNKSKEMVIDDLFSAHYGSYSIYNERILKESGYFSDKKEALSVTEKWKGISMENATIQYGGYGVWAIPKIVVKGYNDVENLTIRITAGNIQSYGKKQYVVSSSGVLHRIMSYDVDLYPLTVEKDGVEVNISEIELPQLYADQELEIFIDTSIFLEKDSALYNSSKMYVYPFKVKELRIDAYELDSYIYTPLTKDCSTCPKSVKSIKVLDLPDYNHLLSSSGVGISPSVSIMFTQELLLRELTFMQMKTYFLPLHLEKALMLYYQEAINSDRINQETMSKEDLQKKQSTHKKNYEELFAKNGTYIANYIYQKDPNFICSSNPRPR